MATFRYLKKYLSEPKIFFFHFGIFLEIFSLKSQNGKNPANTYIFYNSVLILVAFCTDCIGEMYLCRLSDPD